MDTKNYVFQQLYNYGENWNGELVNIPDNANSPYLVYNYT